MGLRPTGHEEAWVRNPQATERPLLVPFQSSEFGGSSLAAFEGREIIGRAVMMAQELKDESSILGKL